MHTADLVFRYDSPRAAVLVAEAIRQEVGEIDGDRSGADVRRDDNRVYVDIAAADLVALRASLNTWETLVEVAERMVEVGEGV